jgi:hypothetical protein
VAVMLNLSPNHLDRHPNLEAYSQAKRQIFRNQGEQDYAVLNADDPWVAGLHTEVSSRPVLFSRRRELPTGVFVSGGKIYYRARHLERVLFETRDVTLRGDFNLEDVLAATTAACVLGADFAAIRKAVRAFQAVEHRLEFVREIQGVDFYNNSKATSVDATMKSLEAFERGVHLILGGKDKGAPYTPLLPLIKDRVREVLLIGAAAPVIAEQLAGSTALVQAGDLSTAVYEAFARSRPGDTVLLAPACSSFDQFKDYEERGRVFKALVKRLANEVSAGRAAGRKHPEVASPETPPVRITFAEPSPEPSAAPPAAEIAPLPVQDVAEKCSDAVIPSPFAESTRSPFAEFTLSEANGLRENSAQDPGSSQGPVGRANYGGSSPKTRAQNDSTTSISAGSQTAGAHMEKAMEPPVSEPAPGEKGSDPAAPHHLELTYVYEVDAVEMPGLESQVVPEDEPAVSISASPAETLDDDALPFEARKEKSEVRGPKSEVPGNSGVRSPDSGVEGMPEAKRKSRQPKLFNSNGK